ncbi:MAG: winged helix-turn-helix transcriptional regulator, partial [Gemmatimonadetes bacterium]|nr:winged helix-turn-helix transcriptional regulator [Gemmatimonadota bacterium]
MYIPLDHDSPLTLTRQISGYLEELIRRGLVGPEGRLPATRTLAADLGVNKKTVEAAYDELSARGLVRIRPGRGVEVASEIPDGPELELGLPEPRHR